MSGTPIIIHIFGYCFETNRYSFAPRNEACIVNDRVIRIRNGCIPRKYLV